MTDLKSFAELVPVDSGLSVAVTLRPEGTPHATVVTAAVLPHPVTGADTVVFVSPSATVKLANLRADPTITLTVRAGRQWTTVEGTAQLAGPDDPDAGIDAERQRLVIRDIFAAAGVAQDWDAYDRVMQDKRGTLVFVTPHRIYTNAATS
ncbi:pyridoxamine 5'-phosphate oxidase family protein [Nocardia brasiliensis]|uniref:pyridoxamine 5'-phosphate oxidase family protein n=1 Tax=Nocardia brasiliensis TaxID=37326 RepID=UPI001895CDB3|nr:pyridoxamine 5'-phosphate oxidase family protein [Nocardia brasiliensis]MBF6542280.1 pyridoxamine 5'-phosphate oxidase family protein [Nocardia brasiliensis]